MPKAVRLFLNDSIKMTVGTNVPGTPLDTRVIKVAGAVINVIDLSKREDIDAIELYIRIKTGVKYDPPPLALPTKDTKIAPEFIQTPPSLSIMSKFKSIFKRPTDR